MPQPENLQQHDKIGAYLEVVREQIRWKRAQAPVLQEIENHLADQKNTLLGEGLDEETATDRAIAEMGDPVVVGQQLDRTHRPRPDWPLLVMTAVLLLLGLLFQFLIGPDIHNGREMFGKQVIWTSLAILVLLAVYFVDFTIIGKYPKLIFCALSVLTAANYMFYGHNSRFHTVYLLLLFPTAFAGFVYGMRNKGYGGLAICGAAFLIPAYLTYSLPSLTVLFLLGISCLSILTAAVVKGWFNVKKPAALLMMYIPAAAAVFAAPFLLSLLNKGYAWQRIHTVLYPEIDPTGVGYIGTLIHKILSHSRLTGEGMPLGGYGQDPVAQLLPAANTDFLLTYLTHRFGWIVFIVILAVILIFIVRALVVCRKQKSVLGSLVSLAIILTFVLQVISYIAGNLGFLLFAPVSLPLFSYGGRSLITNMCLIGFLLSVFRTGNLAGHRAAAATVRGGRFIQYEKGRIIINLKTDSIE